MIAIVVSEFRWWNTKYRRRTLAVFILCVAAFSCFTGLRPEFLFTGIILPFIWLGFRAGDQSWGEIELESWTTKAGLSPIRVISGKMLAVFIIILFHYFLISPVILLMALLWGIEWQIVIEVNILILIFTLLVTSFSLVFRPTNSANSVINPIFLSGLLLLTYIVPHLEIINPFYQIWTIAALEAQQRILVCIFADLSLALLMIVMWILFTAREVKKNNERQCNL